MKLDIHHDPMGLAIRDHFEHRPTGILRVCSSLFEEDTMPIPNFFRLETEMPQLERHALQLCRGHVLDVGAGAGCHSLALQTRGLEVTAIDISPLSVEVMQRRGIRRAIWADFFTDDFGQGFDTVLLLMNGIGIAESTKKLPVLLERCKQLLAPGGKVVADSTDLRYIFEDENGVFDPPPTNRYYGEVDFRMVYKKCRGKDFNWLYADFDTLAQTAASIGMKAELIERGPHYDYLAQIS